MVPRIISLVLIILSLISLCSCASSPEPEVFTSEVVTRIPDETSEVTTEKDINKETQAVHTASLCVIYPTGSREEKAEYKLNDEEAERLTEIIQNATPYAWDGGYGIGYVYFVIDGIKYFYNDRVKPEDSGFFNANSNTLFAISIEEKQYIHEIVTKYGAFKTVVCSEPVYEETVTE